MHESCDEVLIPCKTLEEAKEVYVTNHPDARARMQMLQQALGEQGKVCDEDLPYRQEEFAQAVQNRVVELFQRGCEAPFLKGSIELLGLGVIQFDKDGVRLDGKTLEGVSQLVISPDGTTVKIKTSEYFPDCEWCCDEDDDT